MRAGRSGTGAVVVAIGLVLGSMGAAGAAALDKQALPKKAFIKAADNICRQSRQLIQEAEQSAHLPKNPTTQQFETYVQRIEPTLTQEVDSLRALPAPSADAKKLKKLFNLVAKGYQQIIDDPSVLKGNRPTALVQASKQAAAYGFKACGN